MVDLAGTPSFFALDVSAYFFRPKRRLSQTENRVYRKRREW
jgi:hypothetical protein